MEQLEKRLVDINFIAKENEIRILKNKIEILKEENQKQSNTILKLENRNIELLRNVDVIERLQEEIKVLKNDLVVQKQKFINFEKELGLDLLKKEISHLKHVKIENEKKIDYLNSYKEKNLFLTAEMKKKENEIETMKSDMQKKLAQLSVESEQQLINLHEHFLEQMENDSKELERLVQEKVGEESKLISNQNRKLLFESNCIILKNDDLEEKVKHQTIEFREAKLNEKINKAALEQVITKNLELENMIVFIMNRAKEMLEKNKTITEKVMCEEIKLKKNFEQEKRMLNYQLEELKKNILLIPEFLRVVSDIIIELYNDGNILVNEKEKSSKIDNNEEFNKKPINSDSKLDESEVKDLYNNYDPEQDVLHFNIKDLKNLNFKDMSSHDKFCLLSLIMDRITPLLVKSNLFKIKNSEKLIQFKLKVFDSDYFNLLSSVEKKCKVLWKGSPKSGKINKSKEKKESLDIQINKDSSFSQNQAQNKLSNGSRKYIFKEVFKKIKRNSVDALFDEVNKIPSIHHYDPSGNANSINKDVVKFWVEESSKLKYNLNSNSKIIKSSILNEIPRIIKVNTKMQKDEKISQGKLKSIKEENYIKIEENNNTEESVKTQNTNPIDIESTKTINTYDKNIDELKDKYKNEVAKIVNFHKNSYKVNTDLRVNISSKINRISRLKPLKHNSFLF